MAFNWAIPVLLQVTTQPSGFIVWFPLFSGVILFVAGIAANSFISGKVFADKVGRKEFTEAISNTVNKDQYDKDIEAINDNIDNKVETKVLNAYFESFHERMGRIEKAQDESNKHYITIANQLGSITKSISNIEKNCDNQNCKK